MAQGTFDQLNDALFAQLDKLQSVNPSDTDKMEQTIEQSRAVSALASKIIDNANTAVKLMQFQATEGNGMTDMAFNSMNRMLGSGD